MFCEFLIAACASHWLCFLLMSCYSTLCQHDVLSNKQIGYSFFVLFLDLWMLLDMFFYLEMIWLKIVGWVVRQWNWEFTFCTQSFEKGIKGNFLMSFCYNLLISFYMKFKVFKDIFVVNLQISQLNLHNFANYSSFKACWSKR